MATVRPKGDGGVTDFLVYQNGLIGLTGTGNDGYVGSGNNEPYLAIRLPSGKVPTAAAATVHNGFLLVAVWDAAQHKGQVAVIAVKGRVKAQETQWLYGFPSWPTVRGLKLLGFMDLPFAAPMHTSVSDDLKQGNSRNASENKGLDLGQQAQRDAWYQESDSANPYSNQKLAQSGYAVVTSRAENKVALIDLQPLFAYYRTMYLTSQGRYAQTQHEGAAERQWPFTFSRAPEQQPQVTQVLDVPQPSKENVYIASLDGTVRVYKVGGLITPEPAAPLGAPFKTFAVGRNPSGVDYGETGVDADDMVFTSRGDRSVACVLADGSVYATLRDARLRDPVSATVSHNIRSSGNALILSVMDCGGKQVVNYRYDNSRGQDTVPVGPDGQSVFEYGHATPTPGKPFMFTLAEVP